MPIWGPCSVSMRALLKAGCGRGWPISMCQKRARCVVIAAILGVVSAPGAMAVILMALLTWRGIRVARMINRPRGRGISFVRKWCCVSLRATNQ